MSATIILVDDHPVFRHGLYHLLSKEKDMTIVGEADDGQVAIELVRRETPDLVIMDINMPNLDGIEATRQILSVCPATKVMALSVHSGKQFVRGMFRAGASGYILKESIPEELVEGIRKILAGNAYLSKSISNLVVSDYKTLISKSDKLADDSSVPILYAKLRRPPITANIIPRAQLIEVLENQIQNSMTLIAAPAGYGKSILASQWLNVSKFPGAWVSLDKSDDDVRIFLSYVIKAIQSLFPQKAFKARSLLEAAKLPQSAEIARYLLNDLETLSERFILVLDNYHHIRNAAVHDFVAELLVYPSPTMHLALLTRRDPSLPLASLRSRGLLTEIALEQLRFTVSETKSFLERFLHIAITDKTAQILEEKMEGWVTGLHLAALSIRNEADQERLTTEMLDISQYVRDYLIQDVLSQVPPQFNRYLLQTATLNQFCAPLCDALHAEASEQDQIEADVSGQDFIDWLIKTHIFVIPLDTNNKWFRYHHLFKQLLQDQLRRHCSSEEIAALHSRAGEWFAENDLIGEAINHALAAGDTLAAAQIVERNRRAALDADQWHALGMWLDRLPHEIKQERPDLLLGQAWVLLMVTQMAEILPIIERVESLLDEDSTEPALLSEINFFRGLLCYFQGEGARSAELFTKAREQLPKGTFVALRAQAEYWPCVALHLNGRKETAIRRLHEGIRSRNLQEGMILSRLTFGLCFIHMLDGECLQAFQEGLRLREVCRSNHLVFAKTWAMYVQGNASFQMFDLDAAQHHFSLVVENRYIKNPRAAVDAMAGLAITCQLMGKPDEADETIRLAQEYAEWSKYPGHLEIVRSCQARLALLRGDLDSASRWQRSLSETRGNPVMLFFLEIPVITKCRVLIAIGSDASLKEAIERLEDLRQKSKAWHNTCQTIEIMVLQALASNRQGRLEEALEFLERAVAMAEPGGSIRPFVELGSPMADLLKRLVAKNVAVKFIEELLVAFRGDEQVAVQDISGFEAAPTLSASHQPMVERLTSRELEVLELLAQRRQNREIAEKLFISTETVKSHLKNIYGKLKVSNRREAFTKAKNLGVLSRP